MIHDFSITETQVIFMDLPVVFDLDRAMTGQMPYQWDDDYGARVGVMPRGVDGADVQWFDVDPCYVFHPLNSFDRQGADGAEVVVDTARYNELWRADSSDFRDEAHLHRWTLNLATGSVHEEALDDRSIEFPRCDERMVGSSNRYGYAVSNDASGPESNSAIIRYDLETGASSAHDFGSAAIAGEPVMVPASDDAAEDDGYLMSIVYDKASDRSNLVILDAADVAAEPVATVHLPVRVPFGFHGSWLAD